MDFKTELKEQFNKHHLQLSNKQIEQFEQYFKMLISYNEKVNLTAITEQSEVIEKHFIDSVLPINEFDLNAYVLDIGTGAGFPSIPLKILRPDLNIVMVDSLNKRIAFLEEVINKLNLKDITALHGRCEDMAKMPLYRENFDIVCARAVAKLNVLTEYCIPFIKINGKFIAYKSQDIENELLEAQNAFNKLFVKIKKQNVYELTNGTRNIVILTKFKSTPAIYPRDKNKPRKLPL